MGRINGAWKLELEKSADVHGAWKLGWDDELRAKGCTTSKRRTCLAAESMRRVAIGVLFFGGGARRRA